LSRSGFKTFNRVQSPPLKRSGIKRRSEGFNRRNIFNISSIESLGPTRKLGLRGGLKTPSKQNSAMNPCRILYVTRTSKGGVAVVLDHLVRGLNRNLYEPLVLFDTPQSSTIRKALVGSDIKTIELMESRNLQHGKKKSEVSRKRSIAALIENHFGQTVRDIYVALKSAFSFIFRDVQKIKLFLRIIRENKIDLVHTHSDLSQGKPEIIAAKMAGIPCITHRHGYSNYTRFDTVFHGCVDTNIYISNDVAQHNIAQGESQTKGKIIHNGVNLPDYMQSYDAIKVRKEFDCKPDQKLIGLVARIDWWKGHEFFIEAIAEVSSKIPNIKGLIIGGLAELNYDRNIRYLDKLQVMVKSLGLGEKIVFTGHRSDVPRLLSALDVVVHASSTPEPFGLTVIEGMAAGKPVVATAAGGVLDIIQDGVNGLLVPCKDSKSMAKAILQILSDGDKAEQMGLAARHRIAEKFTIQQQIGAVQKLYDSILQGAWLLQGSGDKMNG